jgi:predicted transposase YdaD
MASEQHTKMTDAQELINKGRTEKEIETVLGLVEIGLSLEQIAVALKISVERVKEIVERHRGE